jgi:flavin reductase
MKMTEFSEQISVNDGVSEADFKTAMRQVTSPVAIVTASVGRKRNGLSVTAICAVTANPPTILVCINRDAPAEQLVAESGAFAVNFLTEEQHQFARLFSGSKKGQEQRFDEKVWGSLVTGAPVLDGCVASLDCRVDGQQDVGTHRVYFGRVVASNSLDQAGLLYRDGLFRKLVSSI